MDLQQPRPHVLREYALLADGERGAVVGPDGHVVWMCCPSWHSDPVFCALLGGHGTYQVAPADPWSVWSGRYEPDTLIWRSRWSTADTIVHCREALAMPGDQHTAVLLRRLVGGDRTTRFTAMLAPFAELSGGRMRDLRREGDAWVCRVGPNHLRWSGAEDAVVAASSDAAGGLRLEFDLTAGTCHDLVLEISDRPLPAERVDPAIAWQTTESSWASAAPDFSDTLAPGDVGHSYAVLRGLTSAGGGMVAAATTSLPEREQADGNYDYRYAWIRDLCWVGQAVAAHGPHPLVDQAVSFVADRLHDDGPTLRPAYTVAGGSVPDERPLALPGYPGGGDTIGNKVGYQFQLDAFGDALQLFAAAARHDRLDARAWRAAEIAVDTIGRRWHERDAGIWELDKHRWTQSRLSCVAGLHAMADVAPREVGDGWRTRAEQLLAAVTHDCVHPSGRWRRAPDDDRVDAALLLGAVRGAVPADDPRSVATVRAVREELSRDFYIYRYRHDDQPLGAAEGAFLVCGFIAALAEHQQGNHATALRLFERNRSACGPPGLYAEEYDVSHRQLRGNLPQAFVHGLLLESATLLARSEGP